MKTSDIQQAQLLIQALASTENKIIGNVNNEKDGFPTARVVNDSTFKDDDRKKIKSKLLELITK